MFSLKITAIVAVAAFSLGSCTGWKATQLWYADTVADLEATLAEVRAEGRVAQARVDATQKAGQLIAGGIADALDQKIADRDARRDGAVDRLSRVRLCRDDPGSRAVPETPGAAGKDDGGAGGDELPRGAGEDSPGTQLAELTHQADLNTDKLLACQAYVRNVLGLLR